MTTQIFLKFTYQKILKTQAFINKCDSADIFLVTTGPVMIVSFCISRTFITILLLSFKIDNHSE